MKRPRRSAATLAVTLLLTGLSVTGAHAAGPTPSTPPDSTSSTPPPTIDPAAPGLKLGDGATLAPSKVLDIKSVVEDMGGDERREDTNADVTFALQAEVLFARDSPKLNPEAKARIKAIAEEALAQHATKVRVFGFTDNLGSYEHGKILSKRRADSVQQELATSLGSDVTFDIRGYSEDYPIASNDTEEGRTKNRRVEISFPRGEKPGAGATS
ncbi:OmpA family protein [Streptomyces sp. NBC_01387]|uniref:OmpA family protein n=1 Tax=unclassified Streptomyces TaxID=2593676 RepID=UPI0020258805|nr:MULTISPECIES: OmpA family protein [unclassified Streptomyces]MCX4548563.1 OmpA family protein [Streptomyces sp. NBC_01500]WSC20174.1 OmpA family protein [Streptomyces sp. NBC_01766]WSV54192.1 OmpA family protein [Streptomyces sp. NBC_01014]